MRALVINRSKFSALIGCEYSFDKEKKVGQQSGSKFSTKFIPCMGM